MYLDLDFIYKLLVGVGHALTRRKTGLLAKEGGFESSSGRHGTDLVANDDVWSTGRYCALSLRFQMDLRYCIKITALGPLCGVTGAKHVP